MAPHDWDPSRSSGSKIIDKTAASNLKNAKKGTCDEMMIAEIV